MSILLESLKQSEQTEDHDIPSLSDSHFDDEMLSDEWLLTRVKFWKFAAFGILSLLFIVLIAGYIYWPKIKIEPTQVLSSAAIPKVAASSSVSSSRDIRQTQQTLSTKQLTGSSLSNDSQDQQIAKYQPTIVESQPAVQGSEELLSSEYPAGKLSSNPSNVQSNIPVNYESLSEQEKRNFPELSVNSFAVSSNPAKSFVVLNGAFYSTGEIIAPHLKLVLIDKDGIVVKHKNRLIRIKQSVITN